MKVQLDQSLAVDRLRICLAGNPNTGKTSVFNALTGLRQWVGNYSGVTVETTEGFYSYDGRRVDVVDLPGMGGLSAAAPDERIARAFLAEQPPDLIVNVVDASNLRRNLYLTLQLIETGIPVLLVLNMSDLAGRAGVATDTEKLGAILGVEVVEISAGRGEDIDLLRSAISRAAARPSHPPVQAADHFDPAVADAIAGVEKGLCTGGERGRSDSGAAASAWWTAIRLIEGEEEIRSSVRQSLSNGEDIAARAEGVREEIRKTFGQPADVVLAESRRRFVDVVCREAVRSGARFRISDRIDAILMNRWIAVWIFFALMYGVFWLAFEAANPAVEATEAGIGFLAESVSGFWPAGSEKLFRDLLVDGVIGGVGAVVVFLPNILVLYLAIGVLESTGYMARVAFVMDGCTRKLGGLEGTCCVPLLLGFGCTVPAIVATRALKSPRDRLLTMLIAPLMSCGARLPVYTLIAGAFFAPANRAFALLGIYVVGIVAALAISKVLGTAVLRRRGELSVFELPPYHVPKLKNVFIQTWQRTWQFIRKAGTLILAASILMWAACTFPIDSRIVDEYDAKIAAAENSSTAGTKKGERVDVLEAEKRQELLFDRTLAGRLGGALEPVVRPLGFDRKIAVSFISAAAAKELFVSQMSVAYAKETADLSSEEGLRAVLRRHYSPLQGYCIMLFCLIGMPCIGTFAVVKQESNSWKWPVLQWVGLTALAYVITLCVYQIGSAFG